MVWSEGRLSSFEQVLDMYVGVRKGISAENDVVHLADCYVCPIPNRTEKDIVQVLIKGRGHNEWHIHAPALQAGRVSKVRDQSSDHALFLGRDLKLVARGAAA
jgi:hypothetical protein